MRTRFAILISVALGFSLLWGCEGISPEIDKELKKIVHELPVVGKEIGREWFEDKPATGSLIGESTGTLAAYIVARYTDRKVAGPPKESPPQDLRLTIEGIWTELSKDEPKKALKAHIKYTVWAPRNKQKISVVERLKLLKDGELVYAPQQKRTRASGTYVSTTDIRSQKDLFGAYTMKGVVGANGKVDEGETFFNIE